MKKLIMAVICLVFVISVNAIDKEVYMPKRLINSQLPDDYPKEIEELFNVMFNLYNTFGMDSVKNLTDNETENLVDKTNRYKKKYKNDKYMAYLRWLAFYYIPEYYFEYRYLISNSCNSDIKQDSSLQKKLVNTGIYKPEKSQHVRLYQFYSGKSYHSFLKSIWLKAKVIEVEEFEKLQLNGEKEVTHYLTVRVLDCINGNIESRFFRFEMPYVGSSSYSSQFTIPQTGQTLFLKIDRRSIITGYEPNGEYDVAKPYCRIDSWYKIINNEIKVKKPAKENTPKSEIGKSWPYYNYRNILYNYRHYEDFKTFIQTNISKVKSWGEQK